MKPNLAFHSPTSEARYHILRCLSDCNEHSVAALKQFANEHMSEKMRTLCTRGVFSGIFTRLLENGYVVSPRRGFYQITSSGLFYFQNISVASPSAPAEADTASSLLSPAGKSAVSMPAQDIEAVSPVNFTIQLHTALGIAYHALESACTFNVLRLSEQDFHLVREVEVSSVTDHRSPTKNLINVQKAAMGDATSHHSFLVQAECNLHILFYHISSESTICLCRLEIDQKGVHRPWKQNP